MTSWASACDMCSWKRFYRVPQSHRKSFRRSVRPQLSVCIRTIRGRPFLFPLVHQWENRSTQSMTIWKNTKCRICNCRNALQVYIFLYDLRFRYHKSKGPSGLSRLSHVTSHRRPVFSPSFPTSMIKAQVQKGQLGSHHFREPIFQVVPHHVSRPYFSVSASNGKPENVHRAPLHHERGVEVTGAWRVLGRPSWRNGPLKERHVAFEAGRRAHASVEQCLSIPGSEIFIG